MGTDVGQGLLMGLSQRSRGMGMPGGGMSGQPQGQPPMPVPRPSPMGPTSVPTPPSRPSGLSGASGVPMPPPRPSSMGMEGNSPPLGPSAAKPAEPASPPSKPDSTAFPSDARLRPTPILSSLSDAPGLSSPLTGNVGAVSSVLRSGGLNDIATAGVLGNIRQESGFESRLDTRGGDAGASHGLAQWNGARLVNLKNFAAQNGMDANSPVTQAKFMLKEAGPDLVAKMNAAKSPGEASRIWSDRFERPAPGPTANWSGRARYAEDFYGGLTGKRALAYRGGGERKGSEQAGLPDTNVPRRQPSDLSLTPTQNVMGDQTDQAKKKDAGGLGETVKPGELKKEKNLVDPSIVKVTPAENILAQRYQSFQQAAADKKASFKDLLEQA